MILFASFERTVKMATRLIHVTDLYHPHVDPDDHFDLAQIFSLSKQGYIDLEHIVIDYPKDEFGSPALCSVYQLNSICKKNVHVSVGADVNTLRGNRHLWKEADTGDVCAADQIIKCLEASPEKAFVSIVGSCLDTAIALERAPAVFRDKCAGIVLNAGTAIDSKEQKEWNVALGRVEYQAVLSAPCSVYWNPCFQDCNYGDGKNATHYSFTQKQVFEAISPHLLNYFLYMLKKSEDPRYLHALKAEPDVQEKEQFGELIRHMWCTASIFDIAGLTVDTSGRIVSKNDCSDPLFGYTPIRVSCNENGDTEWNEDKSSMDRFIFTVNDTERYAQLMTKALTEVLSNI